MDAVAAVDAVAVVSAFLVAESAVVLVAKKIAFSKVRFEKL